MQVVVLAAACMIQGPRIDPDFILSQPVGSEPTKRGPTRDRL